MSRKVQIKLDDIKVEAELFDNITADKFWDELPVESIGILWSKEVCFRTDINAGRDSSSTLTVNIGDIAFWPLEKSICIYYGKTTGAQNEPIKVASSVNIIGKITKGLDEMKNLKPDSDVLASKIE